MSDSQHWAERLRAIAEGGIAGDLHPFDEERFHQILALAERIDTETPGDSVTLPIPTHAPQTPKTGVRGAAFRDGKLLLVQNRANGLWTLPGGYADIGDTPAQICEREFLEETGYIVRPTKLIGVYNRSSHPHSPFPYEFHMFFFLCEIIGGAWQPNIEACDLSTFAADALPPLDAQNVTPYQITRCFAHYDDPLLPTEFD